MSHLELKERSTFQESVYMLPQAADPLCPASDLMSKYETPSKRLNVRTRAV